MKTIDHYYTYRTYSGSLESPPPNNVIYNSITRTIKSMWGTRPIHFIDPPSEKILPHWTHIAWVYGPEKDPENHGSHLVIVWFSDKPLFNADEVVESVDWNALAEDFQY